MKERKVILVNPSTITNYPDYARTGNIFNPEKMVQKSFNPGLLSIATYLAHHGVEVKILDLLEEKDNSKLIELLRNYEPDVVGISSFSGWSYPSALSVADIVKKSYPNTLIVAGGAHIAPLEKQVFFDSSSIDVLVLYEGEQAMLDLVLNKDESEKIRNTPGIMYRGPANELFVNRKRPLRIDLNDLPVTNWDLYPEKNRFIPYIEESRGCYGSGMGCCTFCMSGYQYASKISIRNPESFQRELDNAFKQFGNNHMYAILASTFGTNPDFAQDMILSMGKKKIKWTTELRVDGPWENYLESAVENGLSVLNASPESGSPTILTRMNKTKDPENYLKKARALIAESFQYKDMILKLNYLFYAGENAETIRDTLGFLFSLQDQVQSVSCAPLMVYPGTVTQKRFDHYANSYGSSLIQDDFWNRLRIYPCHLSNSLSFFEISALCSVLDKVFNKPAIWGKTMSYKYGVEGENDLVQQDLIKAKFGRREYD